MGSENSFEFGSEQAQEEAAFAAAAYDVVRFFKKHKFDLKQIRDFFEVHPEGLANFVEEFRSDTFVGAYNRTAALNNIANNGSSSSSSPQQAILLQIFQTYGPAAAKPIHDNAQQPSAKKIKLSNQEKERYEVAAILASIAPSAPVDLNVAKETGALHLRSFPPSDGSVVVAANNDSTNSNCQPSRLSGS